MHLVVSILADLCNLEVLVSLSSFPAQCNEGLELYEMGAMGWSRGLGVEGI